MPLLALRGIVVYPKTVVHFDVVRSKSIEALNTAMATNRNIFLLTQKNISAEDPNIDDLYTIGCVAKVRQILRLSGETVRVLVEGCYRAECLNITTSDPLFRADIVKCPDEPVKSRQIYKDALLRNAKNAFDEYARVAPKVSPDVIMSVVADEDMGHLADYIAHNIPVETDDKQYILEQLNPQKRLKSVISLLKREKDLIVIDAKIKTTLDGMNETLAKLDKGLREGTTKLDLTKGVGNSISKQMETFKTEYQKFAQMTKDNKVSFMDSKDAIRSGE